ncbi:hypothetical protein IX317_000636 [Fusobacterium sp. DD29]|uniref:DUF7210 family protein n=1 Tax=unclassified Fusobacterium TaxID=2648384 RepID=UPI001B8DA1A0|nr:MULTISPECIES: hypothetical protein [unclassified Fusobacterium]MBR8700242.1 hypothetical protein [Fusobacterium sp. DD45]MBR8710503.1 hypothetical protein [Fusobacterium sp. DD28]MBR8748975.1 hypothetical protein [Fusobacterium sp. DD29]MBR8751047.1 hypothetical protein [Fusobacterium sp. DD26]MBR8761281.1 hypothetical protein [Fusobacterium sp. DD25]
MEYKVLKPILYAGKIYNPGEKVEILESKIAEESIGKNLIEIEKIPVVPTVDEIAAPAEEKKEEITEDGTTKGKSNGNGKGGKR